MLAAAATAAVPAVGKAGRLERAHEAQRTPIEVKAVLVHPRLASRSPARIRPTTVIAALETVEPRSTFHREGVFERTALRTAVSARF